jgi:hypothetical protein
MEFENIVDVEYDWTVEVEYYWKGDWACDWMIGGPMRRLTRGPIKSFNVAF